ncbi:MAG: pyrroline-5-carboxylate reductase [Candidatus Omnitrophica bacterium]|nr:pyrroline-5-carboxylate reductase [Candidatus Omnitrophota bacterium]
MKTKIGIIGFGNMGSAIAQQLKNDYEIQCFDKDFNKTKDLLGIKVSQSVKDLVNGVNVIIIAVKPQDFSGILEEIKKFISLDKLIISIAAGISTSYIGEYLGMARVIRVMPNMPAKIGSGMTCLSKGSFATQEDIDFAENLFDYLGETLQIGEELMNAATAVSGSGPGFLCDLIDGKTLEEMKDFAENSFVPSLTASAISLGFTPEQAKILASVTSEGTIKIIEDTHASPKEIEKQVTSKNGTTEAGLKELKHDFKNLDAAAKAAAKRAEELSKG